MAGRPLRIDWAPTDTEAALRKAYLDAKNPLVRPRLQALWRLRCGDRMVDVAEMLGVAYRSVQRWLERYRAGGLATLRREHTVPPAPASHLTGEQWEQVRIHLRRGTTRTIAQLQPWIEKQWDVSYTYEGLRRALHRERIALKVPRPRHEKTDRAAQAAWKKGGSRRRSQSR